MHERTNAKAATTALVVATTIVTIFLAANAASAHDVTVNYAVRSDGLDLTRPADARAFYRRLQHAAKVVCTHGNQVGLAPPADPAACYEGALGAAVRSARAPLLTQVYLETHTLSQASARGIEIPAQLAAK